MISGSRSSVRFILKATYHAVLPTSGQPAKIHSFRQPVANCFQQYASGRFRERRHAAEREKCRLKHNQGEECANHAATGSEF